MQANQLNEDTEILKQLQNDTKDKANLLKAQRKIKTAMWTMITLNCIAGITIAAIYYWMPNTIFIIIGGGLILLAVPTFIICRRIINKIQASTGTV